MDMRTQDCRCKFVKYMNIQTKYFFSYLSVLQIIRQCLLRSNLWQCFMHNKSLSWWNIKDLECNKQFFLFIMLYNTGVAIRIDITLYAFRPKDIFELITVLIANINNLLTWIDIVNVIFFLHSTCSFPKTTQNIVC